MNIKNVTTKDLLENSGEGSDYTDREILEEFLLRLIPETDDTVPEELRGGIRPIRPNL